MARTPVPSSSTSDIRISSTPPSILNSLPIASTTSGRTETVIAEPSGMDGIFWGLGLHPLLGISLVARETMAARSAQTSEKFTHVANRMLRGVLESKPRQVMLAEMKQALGWTLVALA